MGDGSVTTWGWGEGQWQGWQRDTRKLLEGMDVYFLDWGHGFTGVPSVNHQTGHFKFVQFIVGQSYLNKPSFKYFFFKKEKEIKNGGGGKWLTLAKIMRKCLSKKGTFEQRLEYSEGASHSVSMKKESEAAGTMSPNSSILLSIVMAWWHWKVED